MKKPRMNIYLMLAAILMMTLFSCRHDRNHPGYAYMPDMYYSEAYDPYTPNPVLSDSVTMQMPVQGTIPRGHLPYPYKPKSYDDQLKAGAELLNPVLHSSDAISTGKLHYEIYCSMCHGERGKGDGHLFTSGKFTAKPTVLTDSLVQSKKDGEIYHIITVGSLSGLMGAHGAQITPENRWNIIHYIRELGKK